jgi:ribosomal protein S18
VDYKDVSGIRRFVTDRGRIDAGRKSGNCAKCQRNLTTAIKRARHLALLPYAPEHLRVTGAVSTGVKITDDEDAIEVTSDTVQDVVGEDDVSMVASTVESGEGQSTDTAEDAANKEIPEAAVKEVEISEQTSVAAETEEESADAPVERESEESNGNLTTTEDPETERAEQEVSPAEEK